MINSYAVLAVEYSQPLKNTPGLWNCGYDNLLKINFQNSFGKEVLIFHMYQNIKYFL